MFVVEKGGGGGEEEEPQLFWYLHTLNVPGHEME